MRSVYRNETALSPLILESSCQNLAWVLPKENYNYTTTSEKTVLTEEEVVRALPPDGFIRHYVAHAAKQTTSPLCYHLATGLGILAATCPINYGCHYAGILRANMFCLLVGRSGEDQKSSALGIGKEILDAAASVLVGDFPGSPEGLIDSLSRAPSQMIPISEFGRFLSSAQRGYFEPIKTLLADVWDSQSIQRARANGRTVRVDNPRLSIVAACSIPYLEKHTLSEDWSGGFMGRWAVMYGQRERVDPDPVGDRTHFDWLVEEIRRRAGTAQAGWCRGLNPQAKQVWNAWYHDLYNRHIPANVVGVRSRAPTIARKVAMLYSWDYGPAQHPHEWEISLNELIPAIRFAELHVKSIINLSEKIADHPDARLRRSVLQAMEAKNGLASLGEIIGVLKMKKRPVVEILDGLLEEGIVVRSQTVNGYSYALDTTSQ